MLTVTATYTGGGHDSFSGGDSHGHLLGAMGSHNFAYDSCFQKLPSPTFDPYQQVYSGQTITGNVCFQIASNDADSLLFFSEDNYDGTKTWFALR